MSKDISVNLFYGLYFAWLLVYTALSPKEIYLNYFSIGIVIFYFIFLREKWDFLWFIATIAIAFYLRPELYAQVTKSLNLEAIFYTPIWLPLGWATTIVAIRKLAISITGNKKSS